MAMCDMCGKTKRAGNNVSHSNVHTKRLFRPNIQTATIMVNAGHPQESNLAPNPLLAPALHSGSVEAESARLRDQIALWPVVIAAVLALLLVEWLLTLRQERRRLPMAVGTRP
jgi:ribosomal protein L28